MTLNNRHSGYFALCAWQLSYDHWYVAWRTEYFRSLPPRYYRLHFPANFIVSIQH